MSLRYTLKSFVSFLVIISVFVFTVSFLKILLYKSEDNTQYFSIQTRPIDKKYYVCIAANDEVFDSITKRRIGRVVAARTDVRNGDITLRLDIIGSPPSKLHSAFCSGMWFEYEVIEA